MSPPAGKTALVTGSTSGIGLAIAARLAEAGCQVALTGLPASDDERVDAVRTVCDAGDGSARFFPGDLRSEREITALVDATVGHFGGLDILVNNAGIQFVAPIESFPVDKWNDIIAVNLSSAFHTTRLAVPHMLDAGWGRIVNIASAHALVASPFKAAYVAAKHGVAGLTKTVALELAQRNVTVNAVAPGYVDTPLVRGQVAATARARGITEEEVVSDAMMSAQPTRRFITSGEIAALVVFLCSDAAASITGSVLPVDGGWSAT